MNLKFKELLKRTSLNNETNIKYHIFGLPLMLQFQVVLGYNDVMEISEALKDIGIGGLTVSKKRGRGKVPAPEIHASKGSEIFVPYFSEKYCLEVIVADDKEEQTISIIRKNSRGGKIFINQVFRAIDISSGKEGESII